MWAYPSLVETTCTVIALPLNPIASSYSTVYFHETLFTTNRRPIKIIMLHNHMIEYIKGMMIEL